MQLHEAPDLGTALDIFVSYGHNAAVNLVPLGHGDGWIELKLPWKAELTDDIDETIIAHAAVFSILDSTSALTSWAREGRFIMNPTLDLRVDFFRDPSPRTDLIARCECHRIASGLAFMRGMAHEGDPSDPVAQCTGTFIILDRASK